MKEKIENFSNTLLDRLSSPFYSTFIISWCIWNWDVIYLVFFTDGQIFVDRFEITEFELLKQVSGIDIFLFGLLWPFLSTILIVFILPWMTRKFSKQVERNKRNEAQDYLAVEAEFQIEQAEAQTAQAKAKTEQTEAEKPLKEQWKEEYQEFKTNNKLYSDFQNFEKCIYEYKGKTKISEQIRSVGYIDQFEEAIIFQLPEKLLIYLDLKELIKSATQDPIEITNKGKYFLELFIEDQNKK